MHIVRSNTELQIVPVDIRGVKRSSPLVEIRGRADRSEEESILMSC